MLGSKDKDIWGISLLLFSSVSSVQSLSHVQLFATPWTTPGFPVYHQLPELAQTHIHRAGKAIQPSHPVIPLLLPPSIYPSHRVFSNESVLHIRWPKYWSFSFSISPSNEYSDLIFFRPVGSPCTPRASQESSPTPQFKNINSSSLSFLYSPTITSIHHYWRNDSFD